MGAQCDDEWASMAIGGGLACKIMQWSNSEFGRRTHPWMNDASVVARVIGECPEKLEWV